MVERKYSYVLYIQIQNSIQWNYIYNVKKMSKHLNNNKNDDYTDDNNNNNSNISVAIQ